MIYRGRKNELWQRFAGTKAYLGEGKGEEQAGHFLKTGRKAQGSRFLPFPLARKRGQLSHVACRPVNPD
jgi:hypothetical protein